MKEMIKKVPVPLCGVMLGTAALGNLLQSYSEGIRQVCGLFAALLLILILAKLICFPQMIKEDMKNPIMASVAGTGSMALMILSTYAKPWIGQAAYEKTDIGAAAFWFGFVSLILLLILVTYRYVTVKNVPDPAKPLLCIYAAPASLCVAGYVQSVMSKSFGFLMALFVLAAVLYLFALVKAVGYLKMPFYPSYAAFTFPFVISAIAAKQTMACAAKLGHPLPALSGLVLVETVIAVVLVVHTYIRFMMFLTAKNK